MARVGWGTYARAMADETAPINPLTGAPVTGRVFTLDELPALAGERLGTSSWIEVTQERIDQFADATGDHQWIHTDPERAAAGPFGGTIAHGFLTLSLAAVVTGEVLQVSGIAAAVNYGLNKVRFTAPVPSGSRLRGTIDLVSAKPRGAQFVEVVCAVKFELEGGERPVCTAETVTLFSPDA